MALVTTAVVGTAATVGTAINSRNAAKDAAKDQERATTAALTQQDEQFDESQAFQQPFTDFGTSFIDDLTGLLDGSTDISDDPTLQFQLDESQRTIDNRSAHAGKFFQPRTVNELVSTRDSIIQSNRTRRLNELFSAVNVGQATAVGQAAQTINNANNTSELLLQQGNAAATGEIAAANATNSAIGGLATGAQDILAARATRQAQLDKTQIPPTTTSTLSGG